MGQLRGGELSVGAGCMQSANEIKIVVFSRQRAQQRQNIVFERPFGQRVIACGIFGEKSATFADFSSLKQQTAGVAFAQFGVVVDGCIIENRKIEAGDWQCFHGVVLPRSVDGKDKIHLHYTIQYNI